MKRPKYDKVLLSGSDEELNEYIAESGIPATMLRNNWYHENYLPDVATARETGEIVSATGT